MSTLAITVLAVAGVISLAAILEHAPAIIRARADARAMRELAVADAERYSLEELSVAVLVAIERTDANVGPELAERLAGTVIEDLNDGVIGADLQTPPEPSS